MANYWLTWDARSKFVKTQYNMKSLKHLSKKENSKSTGQIIPLSNLQIEIDKIQKTAQDEGWHLRESVKVICNNCKHEYSLDYAPLFEGGQLGNIN